MTTKLYTHSNLAIRLLKHVQHFSTHVIDWTKQPHVMPRPTQNRWQHKVATSLAAAILGLILVNASAAYAAGITVTTTADGLDADCATITSTNLGALGGDNQVSLREAICAANNTAGDDVITLPAGTILLAGEAGEDANRGGDLDIANNGKVTLNGTGTILDGGGNDRVLHVLENASLALSGVTVQNGDAISGGGIRVEGAASLHMTNSTVRNNEATILGGGLAFTVDSNVTIENSTISHNRVSGSVGGGVYMHVSYVTIDNSTISYNTAGTGGGGIFNSTTSLTLSNSVVAGNEAAFFGEIEDRGSTYMTNNHLGHSGQTFDSLLIFGVNATNTVATSNNDSDATHSPMALADILPPIALVDLSLDEAAGATTFADGSGNGNYATCDAGARQCPTADPGGVSGNARSFDGSDLLSMPFVLNPAETSFTAAAWFNVASHTATEHIVQQLDASGPGRTWLYVTPQGKLATYLGGSATIGTSTVAAG